MILVQPVLAAAFSATLAGHPNRKAREKQVAMIAQKVMDANHAQ